MSAAARTGTRVTVPSIVSRKALPSNKAQEQQKIVCITACDYPTAILLDETGVDILLVGDSLGRVVLGYDSTLPVTLEEILHHTRSVRRGARRALVVADLPFGSYHVSIEESLRSAVRLVKEAGAEAVKVEGGDKRRELIRRLVDAEIPVMGHVGLTPQSINVQGGFKVQGRHTEAAAQILRDACAVDDAGAFAVVVESVPRELGAQITETLRIPTIGIGAGPDCDGQVLVFHDLVGLSAGGSPKFARKYANVAEEISRAASRYLADVRSGQFPSDAESYHLPSELRIHSTDRP